MPNASEAAGVWRYDRTLNVASAATVLSTHLERPGNMSGWPVRSINEWPSALGETPQTPIPALIRSGECPQERPDDIGTPGRTP